MPSVLDNIVYYDKLNACTDAINAAALAAPVVAGGAAYVPGDEKYTIIIIKMAKDALALGAPLEILTIKQGEKAGIGGVAEIPFIPLRDGTGVPNDGQADITTSLTGHIDAMIQELYSNAFAAGPLAPGAATPAGEFIAALKAKYGGGAHAADSIIKTNEALDKLSVSKVTLKHTAATVGLALAAAGAVVVAGAPVIDAHIVDGAAYTTIIVENTAEITASWDGSTMADRQAAGTDAAMAGPFTGGSSHSMKRRRRHRKKHNTKRRARK